MFRRRRGRKISNSLFQNSPPVSRKKEFDVTSSPRSELFERASDHGSATSSPRSEIFERASDHGSPIQKKEYGPQAQSHRGQVSHQPTQDDLLRVAMDQKRVSRRLKRGIIRRAAAMTSPKPAVPDEPEYDFAFLFDEEEKGDFVLSCLQ
ncbi:MAG: hypothetical protein SGILL_000995 [Bacillariaceae sp.]